MLFPPCTMLQVLRRGPGEMGSARKIPSLAGAVEQVRAPPRRAPHAPRHARAGTSRARARDGRHGTRALRAVGVAKHVEGAGARARLAAAPTAVTVL